MSAESERAELEATIVALRKKLADAEAERDRLQERVDLLEDDLSHVALILADAFPRPDDGTVPAEDAYEMLKTLVAERDRLRAVVEADRRVLELGAEDGRTLDDPEVDAAWDAYKAAHLALDGYVVPETDGKEGT